MRVTRMRRWSTAPLPLLLLLLLLLCCSGYAAGVSSTARRTVHRRAEGRAGACVAFPACVSAPRAGTRSPRTTGDWRAHLRRPGRAARQGGGGEWAGDAVGADGRARSPLRRAWDAQSPPFCQNQAAPSNVNPPRSKTLERNRPTATLGLWQPRQDSWLQLSHDVIGLGAP